MECEYLLGMYEKALPTELSWPERFACAAASGFDYVELSIDESDARLERLMWSSAQRKDVLAASQQAGVPLGSLCLSAHRKYPLGSSDTATVERGMDIMERALELACDLGIRTIQLAGYDVYYEEGTEQTRARFAENLHKAVLMAARAGVVLGFETMETPFMDTVGKAMAYVEAEQSPYLGVYPDIGNLTNASLLYGNSVAQDISGGRGHIVAAHCKETVAGAYREIPFGTGTTDYTGALRELWSQGVRRYVAEFWYTGSDTWREDACEACRYVRTHIEEACCAAGA